MSTRKTAHRKVGSKAKKSEKFMEQLKNFVRTSGVDYLDDRNITSVGIGFKIKDGKPTNELSIQFTVARKASPDILESLGTSEIPATILVGGVEVPTDVIQRNYETNYQVVSESVANPRKQRLDPIVPGISVANRRETAGTVGCIVFDKDDGTPYVLSNWHVLHGPHGEVGDEVTQPGPFDDNRVELNRMGKLVRSHLGAAGDCAIATIEARGFDPKVLELEVPIEQIGEPDLGDKVVKSGRTTSVTHGIVNRVHVMAKIDYGAPVGSVAVGGFEIGLDEDNLPSNGEISMPGDSGSVYLFKATNGKPTRIMAGLHFAGEGAGDPNEHAIACYPRSVFEKLNISPKRPGVVVESSSGTGYFSGFLGTEVGPPKLTSAGLRDAFKLEGSEIIHYTHFSLSLSKSRRFALWVAWNIDGGSLKSLSRKGIKFVRDPRIPADLQVGDELYSSNRLDRGHIARRADLLWGGLAIARRANKESFFFTNITPQMDNFNQSAQGGLWGQLEDAVFEEVDVDNLRVSVFGGPVLQGDDRVFREVQLPREFFKILVFVEAGELKARAFLLTQNLEQLEALDLDEFKVFQVSLAEIEQRCPFTFPSVLKTADGLVERLRVESALPGGRRPLRTREDIVW